MKKDGLLRIDEVGRIVLPKEMRKVLKLDKDRLVELFVERDRLVIKKYSPIKNELALAACICEKIAEETERMCVVADTAKILCVSGEALKEYEGKRISPQFYSMIEKGGAVLINGEDGGKPLPLAEPSFIEYDALAAVVLEKEDVPVGCIALVGAGAEEKIGVDEMKTLNVAKSLIKCVL